MRGTCFVARLFALLALLAVSVISESTLDLPPVPTAVSYPFSDSNGTASSVPSSKGDLKAEPPMFHRVPGQGPWVQKFANETIFNATVLRNASYSSENSIIIKNNDQNEDMWFWPEIRVSGGPSVIVQDPSHENGTMILLPGEIYAIGSVCPGIEECQGAIRPYPLCNGRKCEIEGLGGVSKVEWLQNFQGDKNLTVINDSKVDGYNVGVNITFGSNSTCKPISCHIDHRDLIENCPNLRINPDYGHLTCLSDCAAYNDPKYYCTSDDGPFGRGVCQPSNQYLASRCPHSYGWAHDDGKDHVQICDVDSFLKISFGTLKATLSH